MSVVESVGSELDRLGITDWRREIAIRLAEKVDDEGTATAASLLRTLMVDAATEQPSETTAVDQIRAAVAASGANVRRAAARQKPQRAVPKSAPETLPESDPKAVPETTERLSGTLCVECGQPIDAQSGGRPRVRHPECPRRRRPRNQEGRS